MAVSEQAICFGIFQQCDPLIAQASTFAFSVLQKIVIEATQALFPYN